MTKIVISDYKPVFMHNCLPVNSQEGLRLFARAYGLTAKQIGLICGVSHRTVEGWMQGMRSISDGAANCLYHYQQAVQVNRRIFRRG